MCAGIIGIDHKSKEPGNVKEIVSLYHFDRVDVAKHRFCSRINIQSYKDINR